MRIEVLQQPGCPNASTVVRRARRALRGAGVDGDVVARTLDAGQAARHPAFRGSPTVLLDGCDPFADQLDRARPASACRLYATVDGLAGAPTVDMLKRAIRERHRSDPSR